MSIFYSNTLSARFQRYLSWVRHSFYLDRDTDQARTVFLCGAGRSGTTWLGDVLNHANEYRVLYEPFNREQVSLCRNFFPRQYLRPSDDDPRYFEPARAIFTGRVRNAWIDQSNRTMIAKRRLVKDVRSTLMLKWVRTHFPRMPIIFLMRHPCAVALSRVKLGWRTNLRDVYFAQDALLTEHLAPFVNEIKSAESPFERHIVDWCVENFVPLAELRKGDVFLVSYENLCVDPRNELQKLFGFLKRPFDDSVLMSLDKPSKTSYERRNSSAFVRRESLIGGWRKHVSSDELRAARSITKVFGLDTIYGDSLTADIENVERKLRDPVARVG